MLTGTDSRKAASQGSAREPSTTSRPTTTSACHYCGEHYALEEYVAPGGDRLVRPVECGCDGARAHRERIDGYLREMSPEKYSEFLDRRLAPTGLPKRYRRVPANRELLRCVYDDMGLYIIGDVGRGKTYLASSIVVAAAETGRDAKFVTMPDLFSELKATYNGEGREDAVIDRYGRCRLLVIDDLGKGSSSGWELERTFQLLNRRYENELPTVVTTQYKRSELAGKLAGKGDVETAKAIISRLKQTTQTIRLDGPDRRMQAK